MRPLIALGLGAALALAGCGGDDDPGRDPAAGNVPASFFGVAPQDATSDVDLARMSAGKVGSYHLLLSWSRIERSPGVYDFSSYDQLLEKLARFGIEPIPYVYGTPSHLAESGNVPPTESEEALEAWEDFLTAAAERYGPDGDLWTQLAQTDPEIDPQPLRIWEIWNEVNGPAFWSPEPSPSAYATLFKRSRRTLQKVDPEAQIMVAGMFATPSKPGAIESFDYLRELFEQRNLAAAVDLVAVHPYGPSLGDVERQIDGTREEMERAGLDGAGLWVTEIGWGSDPDVANPLGKTPRRQAQLLTRAYELLIERRDDWGLQGALWYTWRDPANPAGLCGWCPAAGLVDDDLDPKPAWIAYTELSGGEPTP